MFATRLNKQLENHASLMPDPESVVIDCMKISWENKYVFAFSPFNMI